MTKLQITGNESLPSDNSSAAKIIAAAGVTVVLWASAFIAIRGASTNYGPGSMALLRMLVGCSALGVYAAHRGIVWPPKRSIPYLAAWGVAWFCGYNLALNSAEHDIDAGTAALIVNLAPLIVVALAGAVLHEGYPRGLIIGAPISFFGVVVIGMRPSTSLNTTGLLLALLAAVLYAACTLGQKRLLATHDATTLTWLGTVAGMVALLPWSKALISDLHAAPLSATMEVIYLGVFPTAVAFTTWAYVLKRVTAGRTSATTYITPVVSVLLAWLLLNEVPTLQKVIGGSLVLTGVLTMRVLDRAKNGHVR